MSAPVPPDAPKPRRKPSLKRLVLVPAAALVLYLVFTIGLCGCDFTNTRAKAFASAMKSDLRNLVTAEESYFAAQASYTASIASLRGWQHAHHESQFATSYGVTVTIGAATATGWSAIARHADLTRTCGIFVGSATPPIPGQNEGEPKCQ